MTNGYSVKIERLNKMTQKVNEISFKIDENINTIEQCYWHLLNFIDKGSKIGAGCGNGQGNLSWIFIFYPLVMKYCDRMDLNEPTKKFKFSREKVFEIENNEYVCKLKIIVR